MRADPRATEVVGAIVAVVGARCSVGLVIVQASARAVAGIRIRAVIVGGITAGRTGRAVRMRADAGATYVVGAIVAVVRARGAVRLVIVQADAGPVTGIRVGAFIVNGITTGGTGG